MMIDRRWVVAVAAADAVLAAAGSPALRRARAVTKPAVVPAIALAYGGRTSRPLAVALGGSWLGDVALLSRSDPALLGGIAGFAVAHAGYLAEIRRRFPGPAPDRSGVAVTAVAGTVLAGAGALLWRRLEEPGLRLPVLGYAALVTAMGSAAVRAGLRTPGPAGRALAAGGTLFVVSDGLVAVSAFGARRRPVVEGAVMVTYAAAQSLLTTALTDREG